MNNNNPSLQRVIRVICGKCNEIMPEVQWENHNLMEHNDLGWQEGQPNPVINIYHHYLIYLFFSLLLLFSFTKYFFTGV